MKLFLFSAASKLWFSGIAIILMVGLASISSHAQEPALTDPAAEAAAAARALSFQRTDYQTGTAPYAVSVGDFDGDGRQDLAIPNSSINNNSGNTVSILLAKGHGAFNDHLDYDTGNNPLWAEVGDFNKDGKLDIATANGSLDSSVSVLLGSGNGSFQARVDYPLDSEWANNLVAGDFNGDHKLDLIVANFGSLSLSELMGNGDGTFQPPVVYPTSDRCAPVRAADLNHDGNLDLVEPCSNINRVAVFLGNGDGTFRPEKDFVTGVQPDDVAIADFNGDGKLDIATANACADNDPGCFRSDLPGTVSILLGKGDGTFRSRVDYPAGLSTIAITVGDFNGDGNPDVAVANDFEDDVSIHLGNGDGTLQAPKFFRAGSQAAGLVAGHFAGTGTGSEDLAVTNLDGYFGHTVTVLLNQQATRVKLTSDPNPSKQGQTVTFTATVKHAVPGTGLATGSVVFRDGATKLGKAPLTDGIAAFATSSLTTGRHKITARYSGDDHFNPNVTKPLVQVVKP